MKAGYTLIEFSLSFVIIAILLVVLLQCLDQFNRTLSITNEIINFDIASGMIQYQLEKDLAGTFIPVPFPTKPAQKKAAEKVKNDKIVEEKTQNTPQQKPIERIFYCGIGANKLYLLTFISTNPIRIYEKAKNSKIHPKIVRIVYRLEPDTQRKELFNLVRYESEKLDFGPFTHTTPPIKGHILATNIKTIKTELYYMKEKENGTMPIVKIWNSDTAIEQDMPLTPLAIRMVITLSNTQKNDEYEVVVTTHIAGEAIPEKQPDIKKPRTEKKVADKNAQQEKEKKEKENLTQNNQQKPLTPLQQLRAALKNDNTKNVEKQT